MMHSLPPPTAASDPVQEEWVRLGRILALEAQKGFRDRPAPPGAPAVRGAASGSETPSAQAIGEPRSGSPPAAPLPPRRPRPVDAGFPGVDRALIDVPGIGPNRMRLLSRLGLETVGD